MSTYTKGPWATKPMTSTYQIPIHRKRTPGHLPFWIASVDAGKIGGTEEATANARLIAAAPDLLEACKVALVVLSELEPEVALDKIKAAIIKAEGIEHIIAAITKAEA